MKKTIIIGGSIILLIIIINLVISSNLDATRPNANFTKYNCHVKKFTLNTKIKINNDGKYFGEVSGNNFTFITDPLAMYDAGANKISYAGDSYHFINQDSHGIYVDNNFKYDMVGGFEVFGKEYKIYDKDKILLASLSFNGTNTNGKMYDMNKTLIAEYKSNFICNDFDIIIYEECKIDKISIIMIFCSYYSDYSADNS